MDLAEIFQKGTLYLCPTPIGNLEDITYRVVRCLKEADLIAAEDTRHTRQLLQSFGITTPLFSYHEHNKEEKGAELIEKLKDGLMVALVSDAGMPAISDPGADLVRLAIEEEIRVVPLPGANAALTGLIASGLDTTRFTFIGFLPKTKKHRLPVLEELKTKPETLLFYEAPHRLDTVLEEMIRVLGNRKAVLCRELTKRYEEFIRGTLQEVRDYSQEKGARGEFVVLVEGCSQEAASMEVEEKEYTQWIIEYMNQGYDKKEAIREVAKRLGVSKRDVYQAALSLNI